MKQKIIQLTFTVRCIHCNYYIERNVDCVRIEGIHKTSKGTFHNNCFRDWCDSGLALVVIDYKKDIAAD